MLLISRPYLKGRTSIENVFSPLTEQYQTKQLPCQVTGIVSFIKTLIFLFKIDEKNIHIVGDVHYVSFCLFWKKSILTIHDLNHYEELTGLKKFVYGIIWFWLPLRTSNIVTVISPYTKESLLSHFKISAQKVHIISNYTIPLKLHTKEHHDYFRILAIGTKKNKNLSRLVESVKDIERVKLIIIGRIETELKILLQSYKTPYENYFNLTRDELSYQYCNADILYFASTKEGFGLPILEAQSVGLPVITSTTTSMPYVAGKGALLVNPYNVTEIKNGIIRVMTDESVRESLITEGYNNIDRFSKEVFVMKFTELYKKLE